MNEIMNRALANAMRPLVELVYKLEAKLAGKPHFEWGTITNEDPIRVRLDSHAVELPDRPDTLIVGLRLGDRVRVERQGTRVTVHGTGGGQKMPEVIERQRTAAGNVSATSFAEFSVTAGNRPLIVATHPMLVRIVYRVWVAAVAAPLRFGIELQGATQVAPNEPEWSSVARVTAAGQVELTRDVVVNPGATEVSVVGYRESTASTPSISYQHLQVVPIRYV